MISTQADLKTDKPQFGKTKKDEKISRPNVIYSRRFRKKDIELPQYIQEIVSCLQVSGKQITKHFLADNRMKVCAVSIRAFTLPILAKLENLDFLRKVRTPCLPKRKKKELAGRRHMEKNVNMFAIAVSSMYVDIHTYVRISHVHTHSQARPGQASWIQRLKPRDNCIHASSWLCGYA